ncbi:MAG: asparagine synthase (glutamine-hydrolyzing) [Ferrovibrio sp.]|uniref:asparagine synthase (glutamine-hydrolyzing) n=1 Tax=Ferrovibrio sp. TaxID=1917215 RepID=UPI00262224D1|nr:asparagine synthase (glutamine-hydrolyzing) [Ferrovibrio sp.]MCW0234953.1 asparagine synthase (glutamine-hydrolyzing) [Ferrovibrio sp.]
MCGVVGIFLNRPLRPDDVALGRAMQAALKYRGPDAEGEWQDQDAGVWLGHTRLAIQDLSAAASQPMLSSSHTALTYNGEIYNFPALRADLLQHGDHFVSDGDTEVLLHGWNRYGKAFLERIDGMFSFALWDGEQAWLAGDAFGEKTLYVAETPDGIYACSELAPLARLLEADASLSGDLLCAFLALGYIPAPQTARAGIRRLAPAGILQIKRGRIVAESSHWSLPVPQIGKGEPEPLTETELDSLCDSLCTSLRGRLISDVPVSLFLSGGIDSGLIAALCAKELSTKLPCVTVRFSTDDGDECHTASAVAKHLGLPHQIVDSQSGNTSLDADTLLGLFGQPNDNLTVAAVHQMSTAATALGYTVGLTGMGGDELLIGYQKASFLWRYRHLFDMPWPLRKALDPVFAAGAVFNSRAATARALSRQPNWLRYLTIKNQPGNELLRDISGFDSWASRNFGHSGPAWLEAAAFDAGSVMPSSQLPALDLGSMRASLELRTPFLSRMLFEQVAKLDPRRLVSRGQKEPLRRLLRRYLPESITSLPKRGFILPQSRFLAQHPGKTPEVPGVPAAVSTALWERRTEIGYERLAVRLALAERYLANG